MKPGSDEQRMILFAVIAISVMIAWDFFYMKPIQKEQQAQTKTTQESTQDPGTAADFPPTKRQNIPTPDMGETSSPSPELVSKVALDRKAILQQSDRIAIVTDKLKGSISLRDGRIDDLTLQKYGTTAEKGSPREVFFAPSGSKQVHFARFGWLSNDTSIKLPNDNTVWTTSDEQLTPQTPVTLRWDNGAGLVFKMTYSIDKNYLIRQTLSVDNNSNKSVSLASYGLISKIRPDKEVLGIAHEGALGVFQEQLEEEDWSDLEDDGPFDYESKGGWAGLTEKYWLSALIPEDQNLTFHVRFKHIPSINRFQASMRMPVQVIQPGAAAEQKLFLFAGAKEVDVIEDYAKTYRITFFDKAVDWGWFAFLTKPIFYLLNWLYKLIGNFGVAIIGLTIIIKAIMFPLAHKSYVSMNKMKLLAPKTKELQQRYKEDPTQMRTAMMELYKKENVNPMSGCLPLLLQMPVFFALYKVLYIAIDMRHQPFILWIQDLSAPDPLTPINLFGLLPFTPPQMIAIGILPILWGLSQWAQQKLSPPPADPVQAQVMALMPVVMTFIFASFASGLVLYWLVNNLLSILQQWSLLKWTTNGKEEKART